MRFAYIDSKGKEIELDSVEALALRIELGAISEDTKLYDASQDRWAPAKEHPIFQSLSSGKPVKEAGEAAAAPPGPEAEGPPEPEAGGPPRPKAGGPPRPKKAAAPRGEEEKEAPEEAPEGATAGEEETGPEEEPELGDAASAFMGPEMEGATAEVHEPEGAEDAEPVSFADVMEDDEEEAPAIEEAEEEEAAAAAIEEEEAAPEEEEAAPEEEAPSFEMEGEVELEEETAGPTVPGTAEPKAEPAGEAAGEEVEGDVLDMDLDMAEGAEEEEPETREAPEAEAEEEEAPSFEMEGELELEEETAEPTVPGTVESEAEAEPAEEPAGAAGGLELEGALDWAGLHDEEASEEEAGETPAERERADMFGPEGTGAEEVAEPAADEELELEPAHAAAATTAESGAAPATEEETERKRKRPAAPRPAHWEGRGIGEEKTGGIGRILVVLVIVAALGGGGWYLFMGPGATGGQTEIGPRLPPAPGLPAELTPTMNALAGPAMAVLVERTDSLWRERDAPEAPGQAWLRGPYFANASQYEEIERYWVTMQEFVADLRERDEQLFREALEEPLREAVETGEVGEEEMGAILDRAEWEFMAAAALNDPYAPLDSLAAAALGLHELLLSREGDILTEGEGGGFGSADPILEVVVEDGELRSAMNDRLDRVLRTVAETEAPTPVTTHGLMAALYEKVQASAFP